MNTSAFIAVSVATTNLVTAAIHAAISRAPGWKIARVISLMGFTAGLYNCFAFALSVDGFSDATYISMALCAHAAATVHCALWLVYAYGGPEGSVRAVPRSIRLVIVSVLAIGGVLATTNSLFEPTPHAVNFDWFGGAHYHAPVLTTTGSLATLMLAGLLVLAFAGLAHRVRLGEKALRSQLVFFVLFFVCAIVEILVVNQLITFFPFADLAFGVIVFPLTLRVVAQLIEDARRLKALSAQLAGEVERRTAERDDAEEKLVASEGLMALGRLAAGVGHEINNPLTYLRLAVDELKKEFVRRGVQRELRAALSAVSDGTSRIQNVVEGLRAYSRHQNERGPVDLHDIVRAALNVAGPRLRHLATLETTLDPVPPVLGNEPRLVRALVNLLVNAAQAVAEKGSGVVKVATGAEPEGPVWLTVVDDGAGITPEHLERLSEPYFTTRARTGGMGLGLFVTRGIVAAHDGALKFDSRPGRGTCVRVELPRA